MRSGSCAWITTFIFFSFIMSRMLGICVLCILPTIREKTVLTELRSENSLLNSEALINGL